MLILPLKATVRCELHTQLAKWLDSGSSSSEPSSVLRPSKPKFQSIHCRKDLIRLASLRNCIADSICKSNSHKVAMEDNALRDLHEYHAALLEFEKRGFPTVDDDDDDVHNQKLSLKWKGAFANQQTEIHTTLVWDRICTLWNIAALETSLCHQQQEELQKSETSTQSKKDGYKQCVQHCQTAANILSILKQLLESEKNDSSSPYLYSTVDLSSPMLSFWETYLQAQAQIYIYQMVSSNNGDNSKHGMLSYLIMACVSYYNTALTHAQDPRLQSEVPKQSDEWGTFAKASSMLCSAKADYHQAVADRLKQEWGSEIKRLRVSFGKLNKTKDFLSSANGNVTALQKEVDVLIHFVSDRKIRAENENTRIYQDDIPNDHQLTDIPPKPMVKTNLGLPQTMLQTTVPLFVNL